MGRDLVQVEGVPGRRAETRVLVPPGHRPCTPPGVAVGRPPVIDRRRHQIGEHRVDVERERSRHGEREGQRSTGDLWPDLRALGPLAGVDLRHDPVVSGRHGQQGGVGERDPGASLHLVDVHQPDRLLADHTRDDTGAKFGHDVDQRVDLGTFREPTGDRAPSVTTVRRREAARESGGAGGDRLSQHLLHLRDLVSRRGSFVRVVTHREDAHRGVSDECCEVQRDPTTSD